MRVIAVQKGFYRNSRRRVGDVFDMGEDGFVKADGKVVLKDGKPVLPRWVEEAPDEGAAKARVAAVKRADERKHAEGAIAASGGPAARRKVEDGRDLV